MSSEQGGDVVVVDDGLLVGFDPVQVALMEEQVILVDENDVPVGPCSKKESHLMENIDKGMLHRAFSVFLFNSNNELLMHQRASEKITFPDIWTNTCCSHPLYVEGELDLGVENLGVKRAAVRKLEHELGITEISTDELHYVTRLHYKAASDGKWGEHESFVPVVIFVVAVDHIFVVRKDVSVQFNPNEIRDVRYFGKEELFDFIEKADENGAKFSPWFAKIAQFLLPRIWDNLDSLDSINDRETIHRL